MGVVECLNHNLVEPFNVLYEKDGKWAWHSLYQLEISTLGTCRTYSRYCSGQTVDLSGGEGVCPLSAGEFVAQFKFTVLLMPNGPLRSVCGRGRPPPDL